MTPDDDIYDLDVDLDTGEDDDADALMAEAVAAVEARQEDEQGGATDGLEENAVEAQATGATRPKKSSVVMPFSGVRTPEEVRILEEEVIALRERCLRALADLENYRRRTERERTEMERFAGFDLIREFLGVVDNLERALGSSGSVDDLAQGVEMIHRQLLDGLKRYGVERVEAVGSVFDPAVHEAVARVEDSDVDEPTVLNEMQSGFLMHDRLLRPAIVQVAMPASSSAAPLEMMASESPEVDVDAGDSEEVTAAATGASEAESEAQQAPEKPPSDESASEDRSAAETESNQDDNEEDDRESDDARSESARKNNPGPVVIDDPGTEIGGED